MNEKTKLNAMQIAISRKLETQVTISWGKPIPFLGIDGSRARHMSGLELLARPLLRVSVSEKIDIEKASKIIANELPLGMAFEFFQSLDESMRFEKIHSWTSKDQSNLEKFSTMKTLVKSIEKLIEEYKHNPEARRSALERLLERQKGDHISLDQWNTLWANLSAHEDKLGEISHLHDRLLEVETQLEKIKSVPEEKEEKKEVEVINEIVS